MGTYLTVIFEQQLDNGQWMLVPTPAFPCGCMKGSDCNLKNHPDSEEYLERGTPDCWVKHYRLHSALRGDGDHREDPAPMKSHKDFPGDISEGLAFLRENEDDISPRRIDALDSLLGSGWWSLVCDCWGRGWILLSDLLGYPWADNFSAEAMVDLERVLHILARSFPEPNKVRMIFGFD